MFWLTGIRQFLCEIASCIYIDIYNSAGLFDWHAPPDGCGRSVLREKSRPSRTVRWRPTGMGLYIYIYSSMQARAPGGSGTPRLSSSSDVHNSDPKLWKTRSEMCKSDKVCSIIISIYILVHCGLGSAHPVSLHTYILTDIHASYILTYRRTHTLTCVDTHIHTYVFTYIYTHKFTYIQTYTRMYIDIHLSIYTYTQVA